RDGSSYEVVAQPENLTAVREAIEGAGISVQSAETTMGPKTQVELEDAGGGDGEGAQDDGRARGGGSGEEGAPVDRLPRGERRRSGRLRELRHPRAGARGRRDLS